MHCFPEVSGKFLECAWFAAVSVWIVIIHRRDRAHDRSRGRFGAWKKIPVIKERALLARVRMMDPKSFGLAVLGMAPLPGRESKGARLRRHVSYIDEDCP
jgi:hypothetical protein